MIRTIIWFFYFGISLVFTIPSLIKVKAYDKKNQIELRDKLIDKTVKNWARSLVKLSGSKIEVIGEENIPENEAVLFVGNHQGNFDIPILLGFIQKPKAFIAKMELNKLPIINTWMKMMKCIFMDRNDIRQSVKAIKGGIEFLKEGYSLVIFPEGTRSKDGSLGEFKPGSLKLATKSGVTVVPITIKGTNKIMEKGKFIIKPSKVKVIISPAIKIEEDFKKDTKALSDKVRDIISKNL